MVRPGGFDIERDAVEERSVVSRGSGRGVSRGLLYSESKIRRKDCPPTSANWGWLKTNRSWFHSNSGWFRLLVLWDAVVRVGGGK